jgi:phosphoinositide-3-kinase, regulatory subunit 4
VIDKAERDHLKGIPNILPYDMVIETERAGFAIRQYVQGSLYDRISTRPFLSIVEKKWITYQLLTAIAEVHSRFIYHGDIKTENVMITSWNWAYITDFANFKPIVLPDDNPTKFSLFFDASSRRSCYVAPERFKSTEDKLFLESMIKLTSQMDIFSLGCTIAEMFLEGSPLFTLSQLLQYRKGDYDPLPTLQKVDDIEIRTMLAEMIALKAEDRPAANDLLKKYRLKVFPESFYSILHHFVWSLSDLENVSNNPNNHAFISSATTPMVTDADARIDQICKDFSILAKVCGIEMKFFSEDFPGLFPVVLNLPNFTGTCDNLVFNKEHAELALIITTLICSNIRNCLYPTSKQKAIDMLLVLGLQLRDDFKLDRIVPYFVTLLSDPYPPVKMNALIALTQLVSSVEAITPTDSNIFPEYIIPSLKQFVTHRNPMIRSTYAQCIATIAETALLFLEMFEVLKDDPQFEIDTDMLFFTVLFAN